MFRDHDFAGMDHEGCSTFLERFIGEPFEKIYYLVRNETLGMDLG